jgi:hypothetical protein
MHAQGDQYKGFNILLGDGNQVFALSNIAPGAKPIPIIQHELITMR